MHEGIALSRWSRLLIEEIFGDREGEGRPVSTIEAGGALLVRALARSGIDATEQAALDSFVQAFPARGQMLRWFSGVDSPGDAVPAFLILCCVAASEATGSEANDYRERLRQMMGWDAIIMDCGALPTLWKRLERSLAAAPPDRRLRRLILPDPRFRTQIGHAIELTFPSRQDARRLRHDLDDGGLVDPNSPVAVMRWLVARGTRYSPTFQETFSDFQSAWRSGARALTDHRFWSGWRMVVESWRPTLTQDVFHIVSDEWGRYQLVTAEGEPTTLRAIETKAPPALRSLLANGSPILLREVDWGQWTWTGQGRSAIRDARAALIREKSHSATILAQMDRAAVQDAAGWVLTAAIDLLPGTSGRLAIGDDDLVDARFTGVPRFDGGRLARPSFPIRLSTTGPVEQVKLKGEGADLVTLRRAGSQDWLLTLVEPLSGDLQVAIEATGGVTRRTLSLRASAIAPDWQRELPRRFVVDEIGSADWAPTGAAGSAIGGSFLAAHSEASIQTKQGIIDLVEYLAARPGVMPLGGFLDLLDTLPGIEEVGRWTLYRGLMEAGLIDPLRVRGWRGCAVTARAPRAVLSRASDGFCLVIDGLVNEVLAQRLQAMAFDLGLSATCTVGVGPWSPPVLCLHGNRETLVSMAADTGLELEFLTPALDGLGVPVEGTPNADGSNHGSRIRLPDLDALGGRGVEVHLCRREAEDAPPVWLVHTAGAEPRYWSHRHLALLDACRQAAIAPFSLTRGRLISELPGVFLPLQVARWLRLATGVSPGKTVAQHSYPVGSTLEPVIRAALGLPLTATSRKLAAGGALRRRGSAVAIARSRGTAVEITPVWRWARDQRGGPH
ncbi:hypothetical protein [Phenylobacterium montanum]|uniref:Uncharacterized protein n=1 Tax=Phenylobacterium montanum TaxID=2823693 RepID=A0A975ISQ8_9CAUL|nr:hypothetical protein [Caulobacter sp. S6]QUD86057.1 hypothetical protein KCG34_13175 [Caulobacter sp. S6]